MHNPVLTKNFTAGTAIKARRIVQVGTSTGQVIQADASSDTTLAERPLGISDELGADTNGRIDIYLAGIIDTEAGAEVGYGATVKADANGRAIATTTARDFCIGIALEEATAAGDIIPVLIAPQRI